MSMRSATGGHTARPATTATTNTAIAISSAMIRVRSSELACRRRTATAGRTRRSGSCRSHSRSASVVAQLSGSTPTGLATDAKPAGQDESGAAAGPRTSAQPDTRSPWAAITRVTGSRQRRDGSRPSGSSSSARSVHGTRTAANRSTYQSAHAAPESEKRTQASAKADPEKTVATVSTSQPTGLRGRAAASMAPGTPHMAGSRAAFQLISPPARKAKSNAASPTTAATPAVAQASSGRTIVVSALGPPRAMALSMRRPAIACWASR